MDQTVFVALGVIEVQSALFKRLSLCFCARISSFNFAQQWTGFTLNTGEITLYSFALEQITVIKCCLHTSHCNDCTSTLFFVQFGISAVTFSLCLKLAPTHVNTQSRCSCVRYIVQGSICSPQDIITANNAQHGLKSSPLSSQTV